MTERDDTPAAGDYQGDAVDDLIDAVIEAQDVNQAGFYVQSDDKRRAARHALRAHFDAAREQVAERDRQIAELRGTVVGLVEQAKREAFEEAVAKVERYRDHHAQRVTSGPEATAGWHEDAADAARTIIAIVRALATKGGDAAHAWTEPRSEPSSAEPHAAPGAAHPLNADEAQRISESLAGCPFVPGSDQWYLAIADEVIRERDRIRREAIEQCAAVARSCCPCDDGGCRCGRGIDVIKMRALAEPAP